MKNINYKAIDKLLYTEDKHTENFRKDTSLRFFENATEPKISLAIVAYLEKKLKLKTGNLALGLSKTPNFDILALEMDTKDNDRVAVSISSLGAIYGLWFKRDNIYVNASISVGSSFRESQVLAGLLIEAALHFEPSNTKIKEQYQKIVTSINTDQDLSEDLSEFTVLIRDYAAHFIWLNNSGEISYRELYIHALPYTSLVTDILEERDHFILFPTLKEQS